MPTRLHVEFALFRGDTVLQRGNILIGPDEGWSCFGEHRHISVAGRDVALFAGLVLQHQFELPASPATIYLLEIVETGDPTEPCKQRLLWKSALRIGVRTSDDWESMVLGEEHTLAFKTTELA